MPEQPDIIYTKVDEAPELASASFLPIIQAFTKPVGIRVANYHVKVSGASHSAYGCVVRMVD